MKEASKHQPTLAWILLLLLSLIWGSSFILMKKSLSLLSATQVGSLRIFTASLFFVPFFLASLKKMPSKRDWLYCLAAGFISIFLPAFLFATAMNHITGSVSGILNSLTPLFTLLVGAAFFSQKITQRQSVGLLLGLIGCIILVLVRATSGSLSINAYALLIVLATFMYGLNLNIVKNKLHHLPSLLLTTCTFMCLLVPSGVVLFSTDFIAKMQEPNAFFPIFATIILGLAGSGIATIIFNRLLLLTNPVFTSSVTYLIPVVALFWGIFDGEAFGVQHVVGMFTIMVGVYIVNTSGKK